jgi:hypothetical protein
VRIEAAVASVTKSAAKNLQASTTLDDAMTSLTRYVRALEGNIKEFTIKQNLS